MLFVLNYFPFRIVFCHAQLATEFLELSVKLFVGNHQVLVGRPVDYVAPSEEVAQK